MFKTRKKNAELKHAANLLLAYELELDAMNLPPETAWQNLDYIDVVRKRNAAFRDLRTLATA